MKVISIQQPFASLVALGCKSIETRSRDFSGGYRGPLAIHASKGFPREYREFCFGRNDISYGLFHFAHYYSVNSFPLGEILAVCDLIDCVYIRDTSQCRAIVAKHLAANPHAGDWTRFMLHGGEHDITQEIRFGDYTPGRYMYLLSNVVALPQPIPAKGSLGLWNFEMEDPRGATSHV